MTTPDPKAEAEAREALKAYDNPPTETRSREWGEYQLGAKYTRATGQPWECDVNDQRVMLYFAESARDLLPVSECNQGGWNERYYAHVGRELLRRFPELHAECEALRVHQHPRRTPDPAHLRTALALLDEARGEMDEWRAAGQTVADAAVRTLVEEVETSQCLRASLAAKEAEVAGMRGETLGAADDVLAEMQREYRARDSGTAANILGFARARLSNLKRSP